MIFHPFSSGHTRHMPETKTNPLAYDNFRGIGRLDDRFRETGSHGTGGLLVDSSFADEQTRSGNMARWRQAVELAMTDEETGKLTVISRSRTEPASRVERAQMLLAYRENPSFFLVGQKLGVHH